MHQARNSVIPPNTNHFTYIRRRCAQALLTITCGMLCLVSHTAIASGTHSNTEHTFISALSALQNSQIDGALKNVESILSDKPKFKLAHLVYGDLLMAKAGEFKGFASIDKAPREQLLALKEELKKRWRYHFEYQKPHKLPASLVQLSDSQKHVTLVDIEMSRLYVFENRNGTPVLIKDFYASAGKKGAFKQVEGDKRTPIGVYRTTRYIPPSKLPDFYGSGAFPIDYPNEWDKRKGYTGYGIWVHGTPTDTYSRPPRASDGCVALTNVDFDAIKPYIQSRDTTVVIADRVNWLSTEEWHNRRQEFLSVIQNWRQDWQSLDTDRYLQNYSQNFRNKSYNFGKFARHKKRVNKHKRFVNVDVDDLKIFAYPGQQDMIVVDFKQKYKSDNYHSTSEKRQYWRKEGNRWRIIYEGPA